MRIHKLIKFLAAVRDLYIAPQFHHTRGFCPLNQFLDGCGNKLPRKQDHECRSNPDHKQSPNNHLTRDRPRLLLHWIEVQRHVNHSKNLC